MFDDLIFQLCTPETTLPELKISPQGLRLVTKIEQITIHVISSISVHFNLIAMLTCNYIAPSEILIPGFHLDRILIQHESINNNTCWYLTVYKIYDISYQDNDTTKEKKTNKKIRS